MSARERKFSKVVIPVKRSKIKRFRWTGNGYSHESPSHTCATAMVITWPYQRARWYDPASGRFNRLDPFSGNLSDPQSLHKYAYVHGDPVNGIDPTGLFSGTDVSVSTSISSSFSARLGLIAGRILTPTFWLARFGFSKIAQTFVTRVLLGQGLATTAIVLKLRFEPVARELKGLSSALKSIKKHPSENDQEFDLRKGRSAVLAKQVAKVASDLTVDWRDFFEAIVGPFTDSQLGSAWGLIGPPPTSLVTGRFDPWLIKIPRIMYNGTISFFAVRDSLSLLPKTAQNEILQKGVDVNSFNFSTFPGTTINVILNPTSLANSINAITRIFENIDNVEKTDVQAFVDSVKEMTNR